MERMRKMITLLCFTVVAAAAQEIKMPASLDKLAAKAKESVNVTLDTSMLQFAGKFLSGEKADEAQVKQLVSGLKGIYVRSFEFDKPGEYSLQDIESIRTQLQAPEWSRIVSTKDRNETAEIFLRKRGKDAIGLFIIAAEARELSIVHIDGPIDLEQLSRLGGHLGIPKVDIPQKPKALQSKPGKEE